MISDIPDAGHSGRIAVHITLARNALSFIAACTTLGASSLAFAQSGSPCSTDPCAICNICDCLRCIPADPLAGREEGCEGIGLADCLDECPSSGTDEAKIAWAIKSATIWWSCHHCGAYPNMDDPQTVGQILLMVFQLLEWCGGPDCELYVAAAEHILGRPLSCDEKAVLCDDASFCNVCPEAQSCNPRPVPLPMPVPGDDMVNEDGSGAYDDPFGGDWGYCDELGDACRGWSGSNGVNLLTGAADLTTVDLSLPAPGFAWRVGRTYSCQQWLENSSSGEMEPHDSDSYQGRNWFQFSQPVLYLAAGDPNTDSFYDRLYYYSRAEGKLELRRVDTGSGPSPDTWEAVGLSAAAAEEKTYTSGQDTYDYYILYDKSGKRFYFFGGSSLYGDAAWQLWKVVDRGGNVAFVGDETDPSAAMNGYTNDGYIEKVYDSSTGIGRRRYLYTYATYDGTVRLQKVEAQVKDPGVTWANAQSQDITTVGKVEYAYYTTSDETFGDAGNLKLVTATTPLSDPSLSVVTRTMYRYYKGSWDEVTNRGRSYALKYVYHSEGLRRYELDNPTGNILTDSEANLKPYGAAFYDYDEDRRITLTWQNGECGCSGAVDGATIYRYERNSMLWTTDWLRRAVVGRPDGTYFTQYYDALSLPVSQVVTSTDPDDTDPYDVWLTQLVRDDDGRLSEVRSPAVCTDYDHNTSGTSPEPLGAVTSSSSAGLITVYVASDQTGLEFLPEHVKWKAGTSGSATMISTTEYLDRYYQIGQDVATIKVPMDRYLWTYTEATSTEAYHGMGSPPSGAYETQIARAFHEETTTTDVLFIAPETTTVTLPAVSASNNGSGSADTTKRYQMEDGRTQYTLAADGIVNFMTYDDVTGLVEEVVRDVDDGQTGYDNPPSGFATTGTGLHQITRFTYDDQGRSGTVTLHAHSTSKSRTTQTVYAILADDRPVTLSIPRFVDDTTDTWYGPAGYTVSNHAGRTEASGLIAISASGTTSDPTTWIDEQDDDQITAVDVGTLRRLSTTLYDDAGVRATSSRAYHAIPGSGEGSSGTNYDETTYAYDDMGRLIRTEDATGTVSRPVYDDLGRVASTKIGTDDTGEPGGDTGGTNNMVTTELLEYDDGNDGGNSYLTGVTRRVESGTTGERTTGFINDVRGRTIVVEGPVAPHAVSKYDNLGRVIASGTYSSVSGFTSSTDPTTTSTGRLSLSETKYDELGRVWETREYQIVQSTGAIAQTLGNDVYLFARSWYDSVGRLIKTTGEHPTKTVYDRLGRATHSFELATTDDSTYAHASGVSGDIVLEESQTVYDEDTGNVLLRTTISRFHDDFGAGETTGALDTNADADPLKYTDTNVLGRVQITASWYDEWDRLEDTVEYGTYNGATFTYPSSPPTRSETELRTTITYDDDGTVLQTEDPAGTDTRYLYDDLGRQAAVISNYTGGALTDPNRANDTYVRYTYDDGLQTEMWVDIDGDGQKDTDDQVTTYTYGVTTSQSPGASKLAANNILREVKYPDSASADDVVRYAYNAQGEQIWTMDQEGNAVESEYDLGGRLTNRKATLDGSTTVDNAVLRIATAYDSRGLVTTVTQHDAASGGNVVDEVKHEYDDWGNVKKIHQDWNSTVTGSGDELTVEFTHATNIAGGGPAGAVRRTKQTLPDGTEVSYTYSSANGRHDNQTHRVSTVKVGSTVVASYEYLGLAQVVGTELPEPELLYDRFAPGAASGAYARLDRFDRVTSDIWTRGIDTDTNGSYDVYRDFYEQTIGWTESSNIDLVEDEVYPNWDVAYTNDALERLARGQRGTWNGSAITSAKFDEQWTLSQTGNWEHYILDLNGNGTYTDTGDLNDDQTFNKVNELTARDTDDNGTDNFSLVYDDMGNLTDDGEDYEYVYDVWGRLRKVNDQSSTLVAEYTYNGLGHRIGWHYDVTDDGTTGLPDGVVDADDPWFHFVYDDSWRIVATYRADHAGGGGGWTIDSDPKERFVYHNAGLDGFGGSSYIDAVILRERDADNTGGWAGSPDGTLEERTYYVQNWRADVVALFTDAGQLIQQVRYDPYGVPFGLAKADVNGDGSVNTADVTAFGNIWNGGNGTHPYADWNFDGAVNTADYSAFLDSHANDTALGRGTLGYAFGSVGGNNRKGYAGYEEASALSSTTLYHVRLRTYHASLGLWLQREPLPYITLGSLYAYVGALPLSMTDPSGALAWWVCCLPCAAFMAYDFYDMINSRACSGKTSIAEFIWCVLKQLIGDSLIDGIDCVFDAITTPGSAKDKWNALKDCFKGKILDQLRDVAKMISCLCCAGPALRALIDRLRQALPPAPEPALADTYLPPPSPPSNDNPPCLECYGGGGSSIA